MKYSDFLGCTPITSHIQTFVKFPTILHKNTKESIVYLCFKPVVLFGKLLFINNGKKDKYKPFGKRYSISIVCYCVNRSLLCKNFDAVLCGSMMSLQCEECLKVFSTISNRLKHERNMHNKDKMNKEMERYQQSPSHPYGCTACGQYFSTLSNKYRHERDLHFEVFERFVECDICKKSYSSKGNLIIHMKSFHQDSVTKKGK